MPHDKNGNLLREGDEVILRCRIITIQAHMEYCNVNLATIEPMFPGKDTSVVVVNAKQVELTNRPGWSHEASREVDPSDAA